MSRDLEHRIAAVAAQQHGIATRRQLVDAGLCRTAIDHRLRSGRLHLLHRGIYLVFPFPLAHTLEMAAVLASGPGSVLSHVSAASLWGLRLHVEGPIDVTVAANRGQRPGIRAHRVERLDDADRTMHEGIPVTTPARTLLDLSAVLDAGDLEAAVARAEREGLVELLALSALLARNAGHAGMPALRAILRIPGGPALTRSVAEAKFLALIREAGLPPPECNVSVGRYEVDFFWRAARVAVEVDGFRYHATRPRFEGDRRKDAQLVAAGMTVLRFTWRQVTEERVASAVQLGQALARAVAQHALPDDLVPAH